MIVTRVSFTTLMVALDGSDYLWLGIFQGSEERLQRITMEGHISFM